MILIALLVYITALGGLGIAQHIQIHMLDRSRPPEGDLRLFIAMCEASKEERYNDLLDAGELMRRNGK